MSDEIISEILNLNNQDEAKRNEATESLMTRISSPPFLEFLLQLIVDTSIQSQQNLFIQTLIVLKECIKYNYSNCETSDENFTNILPTTLIQILDSIPSQFHSYIIDYFRQINDITFRRSPLATLDNFLNTIQMSTIPVILEQLKEQKNFVSNLFILKIFIKFYIREDENSRNIDFFTQVFHEIIPIFIEIINSSEVNELTASSLRIFSQILNNSIKSDIFKIIEFFNLQDIINIITNYSNFYNSDFEFKNSLNHHLLKLSINFCLLYSNDQSFTSSIFPLLFESTMNLLVEMDENSWDYFTRYYCLKIIIDFLYYSKFFVEEINSPDFLTRILIPSAKLTSEDLDSLTTIPDLIQSYFLMNKEESKDRELVYSYSVREICSSFANELLQTPELHSIVLEPIDDPIEFESRVFLLSCLDSSLIPSEYIQFILELATSNYESNPSFLEASFIYFLCHHIKLISDCSTLSQFGVFCINNSDDPMIIIASADLLRKDKLRFKSVENDEEKNNIIPRLIEFCYTFNYWKLLDVIVKLFKEESYEMKEEAGPLLLEILTELFESYYSIVTKTNSDSDENFDIGEIFHNIISIINDEFLSDEVISFCLQKCSVILKEIQSMQHIFPLFNFISFFNYLLKDPIEDQFEFIMLVLSTNNDYAPFILEAVYPLILNPESNITKREDFVQAIAEVCTFYISKITSGDYSVFIDNESLIRVSGALIEVFGETFINFVECAFYMFQNDYFADPNHQICFTHTVYLLYNAYNANPLLVISNLSEKVIYYLLNLSISEISHDERSPDGNKGIYFRDEINCHLLLLLEFAKKSKEEGAPEILSVNCDRFFRKALEVGKSLASAYDIETYSNSYFFGMQKKFLAIFALRYFPTSVDQIDVWSCLYQVSEEAGFELSEIDMKRIDEVIDTIKKFSQFSIDRLFTFFPI